MVDRMRPLLAILIAALAPAQSFEVAAIKPHEGVPRSMGVGLSGTAVNVEAMTVFDLVTCAYDKRGYRVEGGDKWTGEDRYDISARVPGGQHSHEEQAQAMLLRDGVATYTAAPAAMLANSFPFRLERTGLTGKYDFELRLKARGTHRSFGRKLLHGH
jgi:hypothetical protein